MAQQREVKYRKVDVVSTDNEDRYDYDIDDDETEENQNIASSLLTCSCFKDFWSWFIKKPFQRLPVLYFIVSIFVPVGLMVYYYMSPSTAYIISGLFALSLNIYGLNHFRILLSLKHEVNKYNKLNQKFMHENHQLNVEVNRLGAAKHNLDITHNKLQRINQETKENLKQFHLIEENMKSINFDNIKGIKGVRKKCDKINTKWNDQLLSKEREVLYRVFDRFDKKNKLHGISKKEYNDFLSLLPNHYGVRFKRLGTFKKLAHSKSNIDYKDFEYALDIFAKMHVEDRDYDFEIEKVKKEDADNDNNDPFSDPFIRKVSILKKSEIGEKFTAKDIEHFNADDSFDNDDDKKDDDDDGKHKKKKKLLRIEDFDDIDIDELDSNDIDWDEDEIDKYMQKLENE